MKSIDTNSRINREIAKSIVSAHLCSDSGKYNDPIKTKNLNRGPDHMGYGLKVRFILRALKIISNSKNDFSFFVKEDEDQNGYPSLITYFEFDYDGNKHQISFHTPENKAGSLKRYSNKGRKTHWNRACTSRTDSELLVELFNL